jgi:hypothetical protein
VAPEEIGGIGFTLRRLDRRESQRFGCHLRTWLLKRDQKGEYLIRFCCSKVRKNPAPAQTCSISAMSGHRFRVLFTRVNEIALQQA